MSTSFSRERSAELLRRTLEQLGHVVPTVTGWVTVPCPLHDDVHPSFAAHLDTGGWICYAGCGHGGATALVHRLLAVGRLSVVQALELEGEWGDPVDPSDEALKLMLTRLREPEPAEFRGLYPSCDYLRVRGITNQAAAAYGLRYDPSGFQVLIPIRDHAGTLRGVEARTVTGLEPRYLPVAPCDKSRWVWGAHLFPPPTPLVVFEGALGAVRAASLGLVGAVATLTAHASPPQVERLAQARTVVVAFDPDAAGRTGARALLGQLAQATDVRVARLTRDIDLISPGELRTVLPVGWPWADPSHLENAPTSSRGETGFSELVV